MQELSSPDAANRDERTQSVSPKAAPRAKWKFCRKEEHVSLQHPLTLEELLVELEKQAKTHRNTRRYWQAYIGLMVGVAALVIVSAIAKGLHTGHWVFNFDWGFFGTFGGLAGMGAVTSQYKTSAQQLAGFDDLRAVGPMAEVVATGDKDMVAVVEEPLMRLLPRLQASDIGLLNTHQREALVNSLWKAKPEYALVVLKALEQVGDEKALPMVERLARGDKDIDARVTEAARECLPALRLRAENAKAAHTLLRGSGISSVMPETLVRPAMPVGVVPADQLMRPAGLGVEHTSSELLRAASSETSAVGEETETARSIAERYAGGDGTSRQQVQASKAASHVA